MKNDFNNKIFPRNLTARAAHQVLGNPASSRTEDGVANCYPGLEMDMKNIDKFFFPGLYTEFYREDGAIIIEVADGSGPYKAGLRPEDVHYEIKTNQPKLYIWAIIGETGVKKTNNKVVNMTTIDGYTTQGLTVYRYVASLLPGKVSLLVGPKTDRLNDKYKEVLEAQHAIGGSQIKRDQNNEIEWAVFSGERAGYLNEQGVLDPDVYEPGQLTQTLCAPWMYDFRDCSCFYWASNKPDVVTSADGQYPYLNFLRKDRGIDIQTPDIINYDARRQREIDYTGMMLDWEQLYPVANNREFGQSYKPPKGPAQIQIPGLQQLINELHYLATVEHALAVQYLYAYYSANAPEKLDEDTASEDQKRIFQNAQVVFQIAIDEMRHFRWANEALALLDQPASVGRAQMLGRELNEPFVLLPLSPEQLQWFVDVERPSKSTEEGLDGMYVGILDAIESNPDWFADSPEGTQENLIKIIKLIIDEGEGHFVRFSTVQRNLAYIDYLRSSYGTSTGEPLQAPAQTQYARLQKWSNTLYASILRLIQSSFVLKDEAQGRYLRKAITLMFELNSVNFKISESGLGYTPLFTLPVDWPSPTGVKEARDFVQKTKDALEAVNKELSQETDSQEERDFYTAGLNAASSVMDSIMPFFNGL